MTETKRPAQVKRGDVIVYPDGLRLNVLMDVYASGGRLFSWVDRDDLDGKPWFAEFTNLPEVTVES